MPGRGATNPCSPCSAPDVEVTDMHAGDDASQAWKRGREVKDLDTTSSGKVLQVDPISCAGHGICAELLPEWIRLDDWGYPVVRSEEVPKHLLARARWAVANCPALALHLRQPAPMAQSARS